jgi:hypothetical protein
VLAALGCQACARPAPSHSHPNPSGHTVAATPTAPAPVPTDVPRVCTGFVTVALSVDAGTDSGPGDARHRAARQFGSAGLGAQLAGEGSDNGWQQLAAHRARVQVTTEPIFDDPPPVRNQAGAGVRTTRVAVGTDGWRQALDPVVAYCSLQREGSGWKVTGLTLSATPATGTVG